MSGKWAKKRKSPPFVMIFREMLRSKAWETLTNASRVAYLHIKEKCVNENPGELSLSYQEMERIMERRTFAASIRQLEERGFIEIVQKGGLYRKRNFYKLSEEWKRNEERQAW